EHIARESQLVVFEQDGSDFSIETASESKVMILSGEPLNEPIEGYGPFVMNTAQEIREAISDFNSGRFGSMERSK
ncbi:MAG: pirin-like C-terminal cupin domain-containing protein, partial [Moraxellaceae bacterium]|nr:pirin-like C-terminal cupin domain-containing protein [Moraxellaceae bacterium]